MAKAPNLLGQPSMKINDHPELPGKHVHDADVLPPNSQAEDAPNIASDPYRNASEGSFLGDYNHDGILDVTVPKIAGKQKNTVLSPFAPQEIFYGRRDGAGNLTDSIQDPRISGNHVATLKDGTTFSVEIVQVSPDMASDPMHRVLSGTFDVYAIDEGKRGKKISSQIRRDELYTKYKITEFPVDSPNHPQGRQSLNELNLSGPPEQMNRGAQLLIGKE
jgi:hypothetical protein